jgi:hypothetical protein
MGQLGFFDLNRRYESLTEKNDPPLAIGGMVPFESFRPKLHTNPLWGAPKIHGELLSSLPFWFGGLLRRGHAYAEDDGRSTAMRRIATSTDALKSGSPCSGFPPERLSRATFGCLNNGKESHAVSVPRTSRSAFLSSSIFRSLTADPSLHSKRTPSLASCH